MPKSHGGFISGEIKLALTLRLLGGGSYLDVETIFQISYKNLHRIFNTVLQRWICNDKFVKINFMDYLQSPSSMKTTAEKFSSGSSNGIINGCIGALDGWLVKTKCPSETRDGVRNPGH